MLTADVHAVNRNMAPPDLSGLSDEERKKVIEVMKRAKVSIH